MSLKSRIIQKLYPNDKIYTQKKTGKKNLYITFDDGPSSHVTPKVLELLEAHDVKATFFVIGKYVQQHPCVTKNILERGHVLGNHSFNHRKFGQLPVDTQLEEVLETERLLMAYTNKQSPNIFRPPQGHWKFGLLRKLSKLNIPLALWSVDSLDYSKRSADKLYERLSSINVKDGDIILFHDDDLLCVELLQQLIPHWKNQGFEFATL